MPKNSLSFLLASAVSFEMRDFPFFVRTNFMDLASLVSGVLMRICLSSSLSASLVTAPPSRERILEISRTVLAEP